MRHTVNKLLKKFHIINYYIRKLKNNPQVKGTVLRTRIVTPKKPNSARRPAAKVALVNRKRVVSHIPGSGHNLRKHSNVFIRGGGTRDLPGVYHTCIRGVFDLAGCNYKTKRRSIYGVDQGNKKKKIRRKF